VKASPNTTLRVKLESLDDATALAYRELRAIAHRRLRARDGRETLTTTALVHEAYLKLADSSAHDWQDRAHFLALASVVMRHVLVDRARQVGALKRGGIDQRITFDDNQLAVETESADLLELDDALAELAAFEPRLARVVECRFFGGLTEKETADALNITVRTVQRDWVKARVLLQRALEH
jgi:RNA polymerase sigma factor (TIGR02999 family)